MTGTNGRLRPIDYYRLPWSYTDNILGWLEPTKACNLYCKGCYSANEPNSHKSLAQIRSDLETFVSHRHVDSISIAGGDPLVHPQIVDVVRMVSQEFGLKPIVNTNGYALTPELLRDLKQAGVFGFTFHIDSSQTRPGWRGKTEMELNELRLHYAEMVAREGGMSVAFNQTIFPETLKDVPGLLSWARDHIDIVNSMVFILYRTMRTREFDYYAWGRKVEELDLAYHDQDENPEPLVAQDVIEKFWESDPLYSPAGYLGGTKDPETFKWLIAIRFGSPGRDGREGQVYGYAGPRYMELVQAGHHLLKGTYLGYASPDLLSHGRAMMIGGYLLDGGLRSSAGKWLRAALSRPARLGEKVYSQSVAIIQPIDMLPDGEMNMCDGCPDMTVYRGKLVWSCRLDELKKHGAFFTASPKKKNPPAES